MNDYETIAKRLEDVKCKACQGTGKIGDAICQPCQGKGMDTHGRSHKKPNQPFTFR